MLALSPSRYADTTFQKFLDQYASFPLLSQEEVNTLGYRIQAGLPVERPKNVLDNPTTGMTQDAQEACHTLVKHNLRLVPWLLKRSFRRITNDPDKLQDYIQLGVFGLYAAARKFDPDRKVKFSAYAVKWVKQFIFKELVEDNFIHVPIHSFNIARTLQNKGLPLPANIAHNFKHALTALAKPSEHDPHNQAHDLEFGDFSRVDDSEGYDPNLLPELLSTLNQRELFIITRRYGLDGKPPQTLKEIAAILCVVRERVRQIETRALMNLQAKVRPGEEFIPRPSNSHRVSRKNGPQQNPKNRLAG